MTTGAGREETFRADINAMRALAVLAVVAFHFGVPGVHAGYLGVDIFFVISGYLIGGHIAARIAKGTFTLAGFFAARIRRIVPALVVTCFAVVAWGWFYQLGPDYRAQVWSARMTMLFLSNSEFAKELGYFDLGSAYKPLLHTWSLSIEGQFYMLLPLFMLATARVHAAVRATAIAAILALSFGTAMYQGRDGAPQVFYSFSARAWEFLVGCAVAWSAPQMARMLPASPGVRKSLMGLACAALLGACFLLPEKVTWPGPWTLVPVLLAAAMIALGEGVAFGRFTLNPVLQRVGDISYSMYLWHWPIIVVWRLMTIDAPSSTPTLAMLFAFTWLCAWLSWRFVEQPWRRAGGRQPRRAIVGYAVAALAFVLFSVPIVKTKGLPSRLPEYAQRAQAAAILETPKGCHALPGAVAGELPYACDIGDPRATAPTFVVWGDSHALMYLQALRAANLPATGYLFHRPGCAPARPGTSGNPACDRHNDEVRKLLQAHPSIRAVVISIRHAEPEKTPHAWEEARALAAQGLHVTYLGPLPEAKRAVAQEWGMRQLVARRPIPEETIARDEPTRVEPFNVRLQRWREGADRMGRVGAGRVVAMDLQDLFCDRETCWLVRDGEAYFRDADHLAPAGAARVLPRLLQALRMAPAL